MRILVLFISLLFVFSKVTFASPLPISGEMSVSADEAAVWHDVSFLTEHTDLPTLKQHIASSPQVKTTFGGEGAFGLRLELANFDSELLHQVVTLRASHLDAGWGFWQSADGQIKRLSDFGQLDEKNIRQLHKQSFPLPVDAGESGTLWLYVEAKKFPTTINITIQPEHQFYVQLFRDNTLTLVSIAVMMTLGALTLFAYIRTRSPVTLACAGYVGLHGLGWFAASGAWFYLFPNGSFNPGYLGVVLFPFAIAAASSYSRLLFNFSQRFSLVNQLFRAFSWLCVIIGTITLFTPFSVTYLLSHLIATIWVPIMIVTGITMAYKRDVVAKYYLIGGLCYGGALAYFVLEHFISLPFKTSMEVLVVIALAIDCFCILLSLTEWLRIQQYQHQKTYIQSRVDSLTGLGNRLSFNDAIKQLGQHPYCIVFIDCDGLKAINDTHGHDEGDRFLQYVCSIMQEQLTSNGQIFRTGGDEFVWLQKISKPEQINARYVQIEKQLIKIENQIRSADWPQSGLSFGTASSFESVNFSDCLQLADQRMYRHKRAKQETNSESIVSLDLSS